MSKNSTVIYIVDEFEGVYKGVLTQNGYYDYGYYFTVIKQPKREGIEIAEIIEDYYILPEEIKDWGNNIDPELAQILYE